MKLSDTSEITNMLYYVVYHIYHFSIDHSQKTYSYNAEFDNVELR